MHLPAPLRAAVGLAATAAGEVRRLPDRAIELPMLAVSTALQASLRAQQRYARLTARGDSVLGGVLGHGRATDEPPAWATFDEPVSVEELVRTTLMQEREADLAADVPAADNSAARPKDTTKDTAKDTATDTDTDTSKDTAPRKAAARQSTPRKTTPRKSAPRKTAPPKIAPAGKRVNAPRNQKPSAFDRASDDDTTDTTDTHSDDTGTDTSTDTAD